MNPSPMDSEPRHKIELKFRVGDLVFSQEFNRTGYVVVIFMDGGCRISWCGWDQIENRTFYSKDLEVVERKSGQCLNP